MTPIGPYCRQMAIKLICLACLLYFALSSLRLLLNVLIPTISLLSPGKYVLSASGTPVA